MMKKEFRLLVIYIFTATILIALPVFAQNKLPKKKIKNTTQLEIDRALKNSNKNVKTKKVVKKKVAKKNIQRKNSKRKVVKRHPRPTRKIASVDKDGILEQITALEARPKKSIKDYIAIAELYTKLKNYKKAIETLKKANKPQRVDILDRLSRVYALAGDTKEEIRSLEMIRAEGKTTASQLTRLGDSYADQSKVEDAVLAYRESIKKSPKYEKAYNGLYKVFISVNNFYDARLVIIEVLEKFGEKSYWLNEFCRIEIEQKYFGNAKEICRKAIARDNKTPDNHAYLALALKNTGDEVQARKILLNAAKHYKSSEVIQWNAGQMSCSTMNWEQGRSQFSQCIKAQPNSGRCYLGLAKTEFELKSYDKALETLLKACPYIKGVDVEIRRFSYELDKRKEPKVAKKYLSVSERCSSTWFKNAKKGEKTQGYARNLDLCYTTP